MPSSLFDLLTKAQRTRLFEEATPLEIQGGENLFEKGNEAKHFYLVNKGKITLYRLTPNGDQKVFKVFMAGSIIAELAIFMEPREYPMNAKAEQISHLTCFSYTSVKQLLLSSPELSPKIMSFMSNRVHQLMNSIDILTQVNANQRLVMRFAEFYIMQNRRSNKFTLPTTKKLLASQLGITPETLSRIFHKLKVEGLIIEKGACITVPSFDNLCRAVDLVPDIFASP